MKAVSTITQEYVHLSNLHPVRIQRMPTPLDVKPHDHEYYEIVVVTNGTAIHATESRSRNLCKGCVIIMPPGQAHAFRRVRDFEIINIYYLSEWLSMELRSLWHQTAFIQLFLAAILFRSAAKPPVHEFKLLPDELSRCMVEIQDMMQESLQNTPSMLLMKASFEKLLFWLTRAYERENGRIMNLPFRREICLALQHIESCITESRILDVSKFAKSVSLSSDHFTRLFREALKQTPMEYYQTRRIQHACRILLNPETTITEVAHLLGYTDTPHFCRYFKQVMKFTPKNYRRRFHSPPQMETLNSTH